MLWTAFLAGAPILLTVALVGLLLAILQAATQINDAAIPFAAKAASVFVALTVSGSWILQRMVHFADKILSAIATITGG